MRARPQWFSSVALYEWQIVCHVATWRGFRLEASVARGGKTRVFIDRIHADGGSELIITRGWKTPAMLQAKRWATAQVSHMRATKERAA